MVVRSHGTFKHSSRNLPLKLSQRPFSQGLLGSMYNVPVPSLLNHFRSSRATNSGPLSERRYSAIPRTSMTSACVSITPWLPSRRATWSSFSPRTLSASDSKSGPRSRHPGRLAAWFSCWQSPPRSVEADSDSQSASAYTSLSTCPVLLREFSLISLGTINAGHFKLELLPIPSV